ncbi:uncharacterized protein LOC121491828 [Vulpes lagopus]|uniref:uncharacterized protein LOC121491828 n=1 Tax=Vulpes lagopus TaxID=494514 RepID=UPI001BC8E26F|nr:uncharacterized protein LOC121491828 [Vulpes lagopus]
MAAPLGPQSDPRAEISLLEINQELQSKLEKSQQDFRDLKEKFLMSEATAYSLANQLQKYRESYKVMVSNVVTVCIPSAKVKLSKQSAMAFRPRRRPSGGAFAKARFLGSKKAASSPGGLEPPTSRLTAERATRLRHRDLRTGEPPASRRRRRVPGEADARGFRDCSSLLSLPHAPWAPVALGSLPSTAVGAGELRWWWRGWSAGANAQGRAEQRGEGGVGGGGAGRRRSPGPCAEAPAGWGSGDGGWVFFAAHRHRGEGEEYPLPRGGGPAGDGGSSPAVSSEGTRRCTWNDFASRVPAAAAEPVAGRVARRDRIVEVVLQEVTEMGIRAGRTQAPNHHSRRSPTGLQGAAGLQWPGGGVSGFLTAWRS